MGTDLTGIKSLMHCERCGGDKWWINNGIAVCVNCMPPPDGKKCLASEERRAIWPVWGYDMVSKVIVNNGKETHKLVTIPGVSGPYRPKRKEQDENYEDRYGK